MGKAGAGRWILGLLISFAPSEATAQAIPDMVVSAGAGGTYYCIVTRCNTGFIGRTALGYSVSRAVMIEGGARWHHCFDCDRFVIGDAGLQLRLEGDRVTPFISVGAGISSDPELMGTKWGGYVALGTWVGLPDAWAAQMEIRGRKVGSDNMGEVSVSLARILDLGGSR